MQQESRVKKSLINARINLIFYFLQLAISFFSRKVFLDTLGADFIGLTGTLYNLLGYLNLAELGIGSAIGYVLYRPLFEQNYQKINEIITILGYLYRWIGFIITGAGCLLACFLPYIFPNIDIEYGALYLTYLAFLASSLIGYFANYKQALLSADQKGYVITAYFQSANIVKSIIQLISAYYTGNYYIWIAIEFVFGIIYSVILNWKINQVYPWLKNEIENGKLLLNKNPEIIKYVKQIFMHKIGGLTQQQTTPFLIYAFSNLHTVAYYSNYTLITSKANLLIQNALSSIGAGIGNLIAEDNKKKIQAIYSELFSLHFLLGGIMCFCFYILTPSFIKLWLGEEYILPDTILLIIITNYLIGYTRATTEMFLSGYGLFWDVWSPIAESILLLLSSIIGGSLFGFPGVLSGNIISQVCIVGIWKPYFLYRWGFKENIWNYWYMFFKHTLLISIAAICTYFLLPKILDFDPSDSFSKWILYSLPTLAIYSILSYLLLYLFTPGIKHFTRRITTKIKVSIYK